MPSSSSISRSRRAAYSVVDVAKLCTLSRARFYDLIRDGIMPPPVYDLRTRRPFYPAELAARCVEVRETNIGIDGRYVMFYERRSPAPEPTAAARPTGRRQPPLDALMQEMVEALRSMGVTATDAQMVEAIRRRYPRGLTEDRFEHDLLSLYGDLRRQVVDQIVPATRPSDAG